MLRRIHRREMRIRRGGGAGAGGGGGQHGGGNADKQALIMGADGTMIMVNATRNNKQSMAAPGVFVNETR